MRFGKREQIVALGIFTIVTIGLLHLMVFGPKAAEFIEVQGQLEKAKKEGENVALLDKPSDLVAFKKTTEEVKAGYDDILTSLGLTRPAPFYPPTPEDVVIEPVKDSKIPQKDRDKMEADLKAAELSRLKKEREELQIKMVFDELRTLKTYSPSAKNSPRTGRTKVPFIDKDWKIPLDLPEGGKGARLRDNLREAMGTLQILSMIGNSQAGLRDAQIQQFNEKIREIGINNSIYVDSGPDSLAAQGQFVPMIHKLTLAMMLEEQLDATKDVGGEPIDRNKLYELIELYLPTEDLQDSEKEAEMGISDMYFLFESLHFTNALLKMADEFKLEEITTLKMGDPSYLSDIGPMPLPWFDPALPPPPQGTPVATSPYTQGKEKLTQLILAPAKESLGYCIPFEMQFQANNSTGWTFLYEILRRYRMAEIDNLKISSIQNSTDGQLIWRVRILDVPLLFATDVAPVTAKSDEDKAKKKK